MKARSGSRTRMTALPVWSACAIVVTLCGGTTSAGAQTAQGPPIDLTGEWAARVHEDAPYRGPGGFLGDYLGLPINAGDMSDAATFAASAMSASYLSWLRVR